MWRLRFTSVFIVMAFEHRCFTQKHTYCGGHTLPSRKADECLQFCSWVLIKFQNISKLILTFNFFEQLVQSILQVAHKCMCWASQKVDLGIIVEECKLPNLSLGRWECLSAYMAICVTTFSSWCMNWYHVLFYIYVFTMEKESCSPNSLWRQTIGRPRVRSGRSYLWCKKKVCEQIAIYYKAREFWDKDTTRKLSACTERHKNGRSSRTTLVIIQRYYLSWKWKPVLA